MNSNIYIEAERSYELDFIDASSISTFSRCPAKYFFSRLEGISPFMSSSICLDFGTAMHRALPLCYTSLEDAVKEFTHAWREYNHVGDSKRNPGNAFLMLQDFHSLRNTQSCPYEILTFENIEEVTADKVSLNEIPFAIDIGADLPALGRIDIPIRWKSTGHIFACDYKTTCEVSARFFDCFRNAAQTLLYTLALKHLTGEDVQGMAIEAIRVSAARRETQINCIYVTQYQLDTFTEYACHVVELILSYNSQRLWPKNPCACNGYALYGHPTSTCEYSSLCQSKQWQSQLITFEKKTPFKPFMI